MKADTMKNRISPAPRKRQFRRTDSFRARARANVYLKDPLALSSRGYFPVGEAIVGGDTSVAPGPTSSRFMVVDYDATTDKVYAPTPPQRRTQYWSRGRGEYLYEFSARQGTRQEAQINAWATAVEALELFQDPVVLGREVPWAFDANWLRILPQGMYEANAFYSRRTRALHFGYFFDRDDRLIKTSLSHDIVTHETAHAILDGLRPYYLESVHPDAVAFHEYVGDVAAMLSLFRQREFIKQLVLLPVGKKDFFNLVTDLAPQVGQGLYGNADRAALRSARNDLTYARVENEPDPHVRSQVLTGLAFDVLEGVVEQRLNDTRAGEGFKFESKPQRLFAHLLAAARHAMRMLLRPIDLLPPGNITFPEYGSIVLAADNQSTPGDSRGYRKVLERALRKRGLHPDQWEYQFYIESDEPENRNLRERDIAMIRSSKVGAYRFLDANRRAFQIPTDRDVRVVAVSTNRRELDYGTLAVPETMIQYVWEERVSLPKDMRTSALDHVVMRAGGTITVDESVNLVHWANQPPTPRRLDDTRVSAMSLVRDRAIETTPVRGLINARPFLAQNDGRGGMHLMVNTARMHHPR
ncbi:hypothetical protein [Reyranella soli]|uniref:hypothetical protein n=1 Tax=Reyranella soli TaxID=1230389 RepID=UPI0014797E1C|nr:hypothetical protein [Reyranella soli]